ncbi:hypothetical protein IAU60_003672 [Kwoniella sp. DSM 27419]
MPIPAPPAMSFDMFPTLTKSQIDAARTSAWIETFEDISFPSTVIDLAALGEQDAFIHQWLDSDSIFLPEGSEGSRPPLTATINTEAEDITSARSRSRSSSASSSTSDSSEAPVYKLPRLNAAIREALDKHGGAVFPKLNWTSPRDAAFILPQTAAGPLHCTSPADVYLLLKSSNFISHDLDPERAYYGIAESSGPDENKQLEVEMVLKKFEDINPSREVRCFVRQYTLLGVSQRDTVYYDHLQSEDTRVKICDTVRAFWEDEIRENYAGGEDYIFDLYLSANLTSARIIDFNIYRPSTDPLLFDYKELLAILEAAFEPPSSESSDNRPRLPILRFIDSAAHPDANRNAPTFQSNMMPLEVMEMGEGRNMAEFKEAWDEAVAAGMTG